MIINNKEFKIYNSDTISSILSRIAADMKTIPYWLWVKEGNLENNEEKVVVLNVLQILEEKFVKKLESFENVEAYFSDWIISKNNGVKDPLKELAKMYVVLFTKNNDIAKTEEMVVLESLFANSSGTEFTWDFINKTVSEKYITEIFLKNDIQRNFKQTVERTHQLEQIDSEVMLVSKLSFSNFEIESEMTSFIIETLKPVLLSHVFNKVDLEDVLFVRYKDFFKTCEKNKSIFSNYDFDSELDNALQLIFFIKLTRKRIIFKEIKILEIDNTSKQKFQVFIDTLEDEQKFLNIIKNLFDTDISIVETNKTKIKGNFKIFNTKFNKILFLDEIMNNVKFFEYMHVNERSKVSKAYKKLHIYFKDFKTGIVSFSMYNEKQDSQNNVIINVTNISDKNKINSFCSFFVNLFEIYKSREIMLFNIYKNYFPTFTLKNDDEDFEENDDDTPQPKKVGFLKNPLSLIEPSLFIPLYTRKCAKQPRIVKNDEDDDIIKSFQTMDYPIYGEGSLKPRKYVCDETGNFKYPGLRKNTLSNSNVFKFLPCCYETNQELRENSNYNVYFNQNIEKTDKYEHSLYKTSRILPNESRGVLPINITKLLGSGSERRGVYINPNSFIDSVCRALGKVNYIFDKEKRNQYINNIRTNLSFEICAQENFDMDFIECKKWFYNLNMYFEPRRFFRSLEYFFQVNIYIFEKSVDKVTYYDANSNYLQFAKSSNTGILSLPNIPPNGVFIDPKNYSKHVFVYVHMGGAVDSLEYPHCEYILKSDSKITDIERVYRFMLISSRKDTILLKKNYEKQILDKMGRCIAVLTSENNIIKFDKPYLPFDIQISTENILDKKEVSYLEDFIYMKRFARLFLEYCLIKYVSSNFKSIEDFLENNSLVQENFKYFKISVEYDIDYFDKIFSTCINSTNKIIFDSQDTKKRIIYSIKILEKRQNLDNYFNKKYLESYFENITDFYTDENCIVLKNITEYAYGKISGYTLNNFLEPVTDFCFLKINNYSELNGFYQNFQDLDSCIIKSKRITQHETFVYLWNNNQFEKYILEKNFNNYGKIIVIYKINSVLYFLSKTAN